MVAGGRRADDLLARWCSKRVTLDAFTALFVMLGYSAGAEGALEAETEKVALFADAGGIPTHAARQLASGRWTSKLGEAKDIEHELRALEGEIYGTVALILKRRVADMPKS